MPTVNELYEQAMQLDEAERIELSNRLYESCLPEVPGEEIGPDEWERVWGEEIVRRIQQLDSGVVKGIPHDEVMARLKESLRKARGQ